MIEREINKREDKLEGEKGEREVVLEEGGTGENGEK